MLTTNPLIWLTSGEVEKKFCTALTMLFCWPCWPCCGEPCGPAGAGRSPPHGRTSLRGQIRQGTVRRQGRQGIDAEASCSRHWLSRPHSEAGWATFSDCALARTFNLHTWTYSAGKNKGLSMKCILG